MAACTDCVWTRSICRGRPPSNCTACDAGRYSAHQVAVSISNCSACARGKQQSAMGASGCKICGRGRYQAARPVRIPPVPRGKTLEQRSVATAHDSIDDCGDCPVLTYSPFLGHGEACYPCLTAKTTGSTECAGCNPGKYSIKVGENETCEACPPGSFTSERNQAACNLCRKGYFTAENASSTCRHARAASMARASGRRVRRRAVKIARKAGIWTQTARKFVLAQAAPGT